MNGATQRVVADEVPLGDRRLALPAGEEHLVEVGELELAALQLSTCPPCPARRGRPAPRRSAGPTPAAARHHADGGLGRGQVAAPQRVGGGRHLVVGAARLHRPRVLLRVPARDGRGRRSCAAAATAPCRRRRCPDPGGRARTGRPASRRRRSKWRSPRSMAAAASASSVPGRPPRAPVPHDDVAPAVLALGDDPLEVEVLDGVVLDVDGELAGLGVERRPLGHGPAGEHAVDLQPQVVVEAAGPVALHDEPARGAGPDGARPRGLGRHREVPLGPVRLQPLLGITHRNRLLPFGDPRQAPADTWAPSPGRVCSGDGYTDGSAHSTPPAPGPSPTRPPGDPASRSVSPPMQAHANHADRP